MLVWPLMRAVHDDDLMDGAGGGSCPTRSRLVSLVILMVSGDLGSLNGRHELRTLIPAAGGINDLVKPNDWPPPNARTLARPGIITLAGSMEFWACAKWRIPE
jgi:hypothetical protein